MEGGRDLWSVHFAPSNGLTFFFQSLVLGYDRLGRGSKSYDLRVEESCSLWGHVGVAVRIQRNQVTSGHNWKMASLLSAK